MSSSARNGPGFRQRHEARIKNSHLPGSLPVTERIENIAHVRLFFIAGQIGNVGNRA
jgi:hypothetical protein